MPHRSVYLHNNELTDSGLPVHMFNGSDNLEILTMSSNFLRVVPRYLPSTLYRLHLKVGICFAKRWCYSSGFSLMADSCRKHLDCLNRATNWRKSLSVLSTICPISESFISRIIFLAMRAWIMRLSGEKMSSFLNYEKKKKAKAGIVFAGVYKRT